MFMSCARGSLNCGIGYHPLVIYLSLVKSSALVPVVIATGGRQSSQLKRAASPGERASSVEFMTAFQLLAALH